jgi:hypothetical protein
MMNILKDKGLIFLDFAVQGFSLIVNTEHNSFIA